MALAMFSSTAIALALAMVVAVAVAMADGYGPWPRPLPWAITMGQDLGPWACPWFWQRKAETAGFMAFLVTSHVDATGKKEIKHATRGHGFKKKSRAAPAEIEDANW